MFSSHECRCFPQEILDQFADIDLVLNFKSTEQDPLAKNLGTGAFPPSLDSTNLHITGSKPGLRSPGERLVSADVSSAWKENLTVYAEQVGCILEYNSEVLYVRFKPVVFLSFQYAMSYVWGSIQCCYACA